MSARKLERGALGKQQIIEYKYDESKEREILGVEKLKQGGEMRVGKMRSLGTEG